MKIVGLLGAKHFSTRLYAKGWRDFSGKPMFQWNVEKGLKLFEEMYVSSDHYPILAKSEELGAKIILRTDPKLMDCPNITYYQHAYKLMGEPDVIVAIQVNSPTVPIDVIEEVIYLMEQGKEEVKTCHEDGSDYGSVWAMTKKRLFDYPDPYHAKPDVWVKDNSIDIHTIKDLQEALKQL